MKPPSSSTRATTQPWNRFRSLPITRSPDHPILPGFPQPDCATIGSVSETPQSAKAQTSEFPFAVTVGRIFDGPLDLLLELIRKQDIDIYNIPIAKITGQYLAYVENLKELDVDVAAEFIYMASLLIHIKSKMLLPRDPDLPPDQQEDPRDELVQRLLEHEKFKNAAQMLLQ